MSSQDRRLLWIPFGFSNTMSKYLPINKGN